MPQSRLTGAGIRRLRTLSLPGLQRKTENTAHESALTERMAQAMEGYPETQAVLVRRHGVYVWGADWVEAKTQAECYDYLFEAAVRMRHLGIDAAQRPVSRPKQVSA